jgi:hypothetical protein
MALFLPVAASAQERLAYVLRIEGADVFVDLGRAEGASPGTRLRVYRTIEARHPATGKVLKDRFLLGELTVAEAGEALSRVQAPSDLLGRLEVGDAVEPPAARAEAPPLPVATRPPGQPAPAPTGRPAAAPELGELRATWERAIQLPPRERADAWERFLSAHPDTPLAGPLRAEIALLRSAADAQERRPTLPNARAALQTAVSAPSRILRGEPLAVAVATVQGPPPRAALLHWRQPGTPTFKTVHLTADGEGYFRGRLPSEGAVEPGIEYYVELVDAAGETQLAAGSPKAPVPVEIRIAPGQEPLDTRDRSRVRLRDEYVDFNRFVGNDSYNLTEGDFLYRVYGFVHSVRVGFGIYQGYGTPKALLDEGVSEATRPIGYTYGFGEVELRLHESVSVLLKASAGVTRDGLKNGIEGRLRLGSETGTSLVVGGATTANIGQRGNIELAWNAVQGWPMSAEVIVTNEPIGEDLGVRLIYSVGRSVTPWLDVQGRIGYQLRDINHSGLSFGLGTTFHW